MTSTQEGWGLPQHMKALRAHRRGGPEQLVYEDAPVPAPAAGDDVCVKVHVAAITFDELTWPDTWEEDGKDRTPIIPSHELSGVAVAIGPDVSGISVGDPVFGLVPFNRNGAAAEYVVAPATYLTRKPHGVTDAVAAASVLPALTAMEALDDQLGLTAGQRLLVRGGAGAVGASIVQLAHAMGVEVAATVRTRQSGDYVKELGAEAILGDEHPGIAAGTFDAAIDAAGAGTPEWLYGSVRRGGRLVTLQEPPATDIAARYGIDAGFFVVGHDQTRLARVADALEHGKLRAAIARSYPLAEGRSAYASRGTSHAPGKTLLSMAGE
jgi:NADPH:quinone reductase-like Zn-dependent oxidoreductase